MRSLFLAAAVLLFLQKANAAEPLRAFAGIKGFPQKPFADWKEGDAEPSGLDADLVRLVARKLGVDIEFVDPDMRRRWVDLRRELLEERTVDLVVYAYTVTEPRKEHVHFSRPYLTTSLAALVRKDSMINSVEGVKKSRVLAFSHTTAWPWAKEHVTGQVVDEVGADFDGIESFLLAGKVDVFLGDAKNLHQIAAENPKFRIIEEPLQCEQLAMAVHKGSVALLKSINIALEALEREGALEELRRKHLTPANTKSATD